jgi:hypothetical protein
MKHLPLSICIIATLLFSGCMTTPVAKTGGLGAVTVTNSNPLAITNAAQGVFAQYGYTPGPGEFPDWISFDKPAGGFGKLMYGSYGVTTTIRTRVNITQIPGTNDYRLSARPTVVSDAGEAGFEDSRRMMGLWSGQFGPLLKQVQAQASGAGAY